MSPLTTGLLVVVGVALFAWLLRRMSGGGGVDRELLSGRAPQPERAEPRAAEAEPEPDDEDESDEVAAITSEGFMFMPFADGVELLATAAPEELAEQLAQRAYRGSRLVGMLSRGDLIAARVVRGAPSVDPWRLEALGRDRDYLSWSFETEEAAHTALDMLERLVVKAPAEPDGETTAVTAEDFAAARRVKEETLRELAMMPESEEPEEPR